MPLLINFKLNAAALLPEIQRLIALSGQKLRLLQKNWDLSRGAPVFTRRGKYATRGWTEWTEGFHHGSALLQFDLSGDSEFLEWGRRATVQRMAIHVSHTGVHDHGFHTMSTYGNLLRLMGEGKIPADPWERNFYELAVKISGAIQAARWTSLPQDGYIYSFNGPHSLFIDTLRSLRVLGAAHQLGHLLMSEQDERVSLLARLIQHARTTARYSIFYGKHRDAYDVPGRTAHEIIFNVRNGAYRCPNSQQGFSPFTTWSRGLAWAICGFAEQLEFVEALPAADLQPWGGRATVRKWMAGAALAASEYYLDQCCADGIPLWDTGAPNAAELGAYREKPSDPFNRCEPVDSSAAAIAAQGLLRLGNFFAGRRDSAKARRYRQASFSIARALMNEPYLSTRPSHEGLLLHSVYHRPNGWDYVAPGEKIPNGESTMWGDYHLRELALLVAREARAQPYPAFFSIRSNDASSRRYAPTAFA